MTELGEIDVKPPSDEPEESRSVAPMVAVAVIVVALIGVAVYWFTGRDTEDTPAPQPATVQAPPPRTVSPPEPVDPEPVGLPSLDESDPSIRDLVSALSSHPGFAAWLVNDGLIRRFVVTVDNVADGRNPSQHVPFMKPERRFGVSGVEPNVRVDPRSYRRYDTHAQIIDSLDTSGVAELYQRLEPLMTQAYDELGSPDTRFRSTFERAISHLLEVPVVEGPPVVMMGAAFYEYTDERLDSLTPVQKQFLGMGPDNVRTVQAKMRAVAGAIGLRIAR